MNLGKKFKNLQHKLADRRYFIMNRFEHVWGGVCTEGGPCTELRHFTGVVGW